MQHSFLLCWQFLCTLSAGTASACSLRPVLFPQESAQNCPYFMPDLDELLPEVVYVLK
uniref:Lipoprotein n=1 Tax=Staphylococcus arlettae TaxID=29378 RepID=A0A1W5QC81_9STAP|nr:hypothetical protein [Staphylococcus arlettae]